MHSRLKLLYLRLLILSILMINETPSHFADGLKCWKCKSDGLCNEEREGEPVECDNGICFTQEIHNLYEGYNIVKDCETRGDAHNTKTGSCDNPTPETTKCYCRNQDNCNRFKIELVDEHGNEVATKGSISSAGIVRPSNHYCLLGLSLIGMSIIVLNLKCSS